MAIASLGVASGTTSTIPPTSGYWSLYYDTTLGGWATRAYSGSPTLLAGLSISLPSGQIYVGNAGGAATAVTPSGDWTISNTGATVVSQIGGKSVTLGGSLATSGAFGLTMTLTGATSVVLPTSGTLLNNTLTAAQFYVGNGSNVATGVAMSGDAALANTGAVTVSKIGGQAVSLAGAFTTASALTISGAFASTFTLTGSTTVTFPVSGTLATTNQTGFPASATGAQTITSGTALATSIPSTLTGNIRILWNSATAGVKNVPLPAPTGSGFEILVLDFLGTSNQGGNAIQVYGSTSAVLINGAQTNQSTGLATATIANAFGVIRLCDVSATAWQIVGTV